VMIPTSEDVDAALVSESTGGIGVERFDLS
jgi:hypothetical protein